MGDFTYGDSTTITPVGKKPRLWKSPGDQPAEVPYMYPMGETVQPEETERGSESPVGNELSRR